MNTGSLGDELKNTAALSFKDVSFAYPGAEQPVLEHISFEVAKGSFTSVIGASGSGKTTLFRLLNRFEKLTKGEILVEGAPIETLKTVASYMPQEDTLFPWLNVQENVCLPMKVRKIPKKEREEQAGRLLRQVGLDGWEKSRVSELSGGMRQRAAFARTLCAGEDLLLLDEPFSALDSITRISLQEWLLEQWEELGKTILFVTHDVEEAIFLSEQVMVLKGKPVNEVQIVPIPLPRERTREMLMRPEILELKEMLIRSLQSEAQI
ncbi:MAG: ABC transporter ATP-binding protein [Lachnospiraceae bacterium]|nr:ABC transporter ATP-binding protein [Lachnospiraceae bacterium]